MTSSWVSLADLKNDLDIDFPDARDDNDLAEVLKAAIAFVQRVRPDLEDEIPADVKLGIVRLAARWWSRRRSPAALIEMGDLGAARVPSFDPDIERLLKIGRFAPARFA